MLKWIDVPPVWLLGFAALAWAQGRWVPVASFGPLGPVAGGGAIVAGGVLMAAAVFAFARHRTSVIPRRDPSDIITSGVFAWTRNPIYLGDALVLLGLILWWDAVPSLILLPAFVVLIERRFILGEERRLDRLFPEAFAAYRARVRRWI